jgi:hypothetical protein
MLRSLCLSAVALCAAATNASAQPAVLRLDEGARVRVVVTEPGGPLRLEGRVVSFDSDSLRVTSGADSRVLSVGALREVGVLHRTSRVAGARNGARWGLFLGTSIGGIAGGLTAKSTNVGITEALAIGAVGGGFVGAATGATFFPEQWTQYRMVQAAPNPPLATR